MPDKKLVRLFYALELADNLKESIRALIFPYSNSSSAIKWIKPENLHLTLRFLGNVSDNTVPVLVSILESIAMEEKSFLISLRNTGVFPSLRKPSVLWIGIDKGAGECKKISTVLNNRLTEIGLTEESRIFKPHITIGRSKKNVPPQHLAHLYERIIKESADRFIGACQMDSILLIKSTLTREGPIYTTVAKSYFK